MSISMSDLWEQLQFTRDRNWLECEGGSRKWQFHITTLYGKTHLKLIFFNYLEVFVSNAKLVYSLWYRVSWATSKTSLSTSFIEPKLFDELQVFFCLFFNAEKNWQKHAIARLYTRIQYWSDLAAQCHSCCWNVWVFSHRLFSLLAPTEKSIRVQKIAAL